MKVKEERGNLSTEGYPKEYLKEIDTDKTDSYSILIIVGDLIYPNQITFIILLCNIHVILFFF